MLGAAGVGGVVFDSDGNKNIEYSWGLDSATNNQVEILVVYMGLNLISADNLVRLITIGDSNLIIKGLCRIIKKLILVYDRHIAKSRIWSKNFSHLVIIMY
jgi:ribonuclease HI